MLFGEKLINAGLINQTQLDEALEKQKSQPGTKIGDILISMGYMDPDKFKEFLG